MTVLPIGSFDSQVCIYGLRRMDKEFEGGFYVDSLPQLCIIECFLVGSQNREIWKVLSYPWVY